MNTKVMQNFKMHLKLRVLHVQYTFSLLFKLSNRRNTATIRIFLIIFRMVSERKMSKIYDHPLHQFTKQRLFCGCY